MWRALLHAMLAVMALVAARPAFADAPALFDAPALSDGELAAQRGGFTLPGGIDVALAATVTTSVDGAPVLTTTFRIDGDVASVATNGVLATVTATGSAVQSTVKGAIVAAPTVTVTIAKAVAPVVPAAAGTTANAAPTTTTILTGTGTLASTASLDGLQVTHFVGDRIGAMVANSGDGRIINQSLTLDLTLGNVAPFMIGSTLARVQNVGIEAGMWRGAGG